MKVCMVAYAFYETDARISQYANALVERGDSVDVICLRREGSPKHEILNGVNIYRIQLRVRNESGPWRYLCRITRFLLHAAVLLATKHPKVGRHLIHVHSVPDFLVFAAIAPKVFGAAVILDVHDILPEFYASKFDVREDSLIFRTLIWVEKRSAAFADHVIVANHLWHRRLVSRSVSSSKCTTICNYPDPTLFYRRPRKRDDGKFLIMYPGTLNQHQGLDIAIQAFARIADEIPEAEFHIYGDGPARAGLEQAVREQGLCRRVIFSSPIPAQRIAELMAQSDLAIVPKRAGKSFGNEAASTKIREFMALGVPVIVSRTRIDSSYYDDSLVKFFTPESECELADSIRLLWRDCEWRERLAAKALEYSRENSWTQKKQGYLDLVDSLCSRVSRREDHAELPSGPDFERPTLRGND